MLPMQVLCAQISNKYLSGGLIIPFIFWLSKCDGGYTYNLATLCRIEITVIDSNYLLNISRYKQNPKSRFRQIILNFELMTV